MSIKEAQEEKAIRILHRKQYKLRQEQNKNKKLDLKTLKEEIDLYQDAFNELKKITGANDVNEIIQKYLI